MASAQNKYLVSEGEEFQIEYVSRNFGSQRTTVFAIDSSGNVNITPPAGSKLTIGSKGNVAAGLDTTVADIAPLAAAAAAGAVGLAADAGHVHQLDKAAFRVVYFNGVAAAGPVTIASLKIGDQVLMILDVTAAPAINGAANFEATVTVNGQLQQSSASNLSAKSYVAIIVAKS